MSDLRTLIDRPLLPLLTLLSVAAVLSSCGQRPAVMSEATMSTQTTSSEIELSSSGLTLDPSLLFQTRWFSGKVTGYSCTAPWWNQAQMNAELLAHPMYLRITATTPRFFLGGSRTLNARFHFIKGPSEYLYFSGTQLQNTLKVDGSLSTQQDGQAGDVGTGYVLDSDALSSGTALRGVLSVKVACGQLVNGVQVNYPGQIFFHTDRV